MTTEQPSPRGTLASKRLCWAVLLLVVPGLLVPGALFPVPTPRMRDAEQPGGARGLGRALLAATAIPAHDFLQRDPWPVLLLPVPLPSRLVPRRRRLRTARPPASGGSHMSRTRRTRSATRLARRLALVAVTLFTAVLPAAAQTTVAPPDPVPARWWGQVWGTVEMEPKIVRPGDQVTLTATTWNGGAGEPGFYCSSGAGWRVSGTGHVGVKINGSCFEVLGYEPAASEYVTVTTTPYMISWDGKSGPPPTASVARELNPNAGADCYCHVDWWGARSETSGCSKPIGLFRKGQTFKVLLRAKANPPAYCNTQGKYYRVTQTWGGGAEFSGNNGPNWFDQAEYYYRFDMNPNGARPVPDLAMSADPVSATLDQSVTVRALVTDPVTGAAMPGQTVSFSTTIGTLTALSSITDTNGVASVTLSPDSLPGSATVRAAVGTASSGTVDVTFTTETTAQSTDPVLRRYFAEGSTEPLFTTTIAVANPSADPARATMKYLTAAGTAIDQQVTIPAHGRRTVVLNTDVPGLGATPVSTVIESTTALVADRTMTWDASGYGSHSETAILEPRTQWYFAEGATHSGFNLFYLVQNPDTLPAQVTVTYLRPAPLPPIAKVYQVGAQSRFNIWVNQEGAELASTDVSATLSSTRPVIAERAMYLNAGGLLFGAGHESAAIAEPALRWFFAEGSTGTFFDLFLLVANPGTQEAHVRATYMLQDGTTIEKSYIVGPQSRYNIWVDYEDAALADAAVSTALDVTNGVPVIAERSMWWPGTNWIEAHNAAGSTQTGTEWAVADGEQGGTRKLETYLLVANTSETPALVLVTLLFEEGVTLERAFDVAARSRFTVNVGNEFPFATGKRFGAVVRSIGASPAQIVVERAVYGSSGAVTWAAGSNALATRLK